MQREVSYTSARRRQLSALHIDKKLYSILGKRDELETRLSEECSNFERLNTF